MNNLSPQELLVGKESDLPRPKETGLSKVEIEKIAEKAASTFGYRPGEELNPIVEKLGGKVIVGKIHETGSTGFLEVAEDGAFEICVSPYPGAYRNRFTIAHELGHFVLHSCMGEKPVFATRQAGSRVEWEANWFAGAFLMPSELFTREWKKAAGSIGHLINRFNVSGGAVEIRAKTLREMGILHLS